MAAARPLLKCGAVMESLEDPTLGELDSEGKIHPDLAELYDRILGAGWRDCRLSSAIEAIVERGRRAEDRHTGAGGTPHIA